MHCTVRTDRDDVCTRHTISSHIHILQQQIVDNISQLLQHKRICNDAVKLGRGRGGGGGAGATETMPLPSNNEIME